MLSLLLLVCNQQDMITSQNTKTVALRRLSTLFFYLSLPIQNFYNSRNATENSMYVFLITEIRIQYLHSFNVTRTC